LVRLDEAIKAMRALWQSDSEAFRGRFYATEGIRLDPHPIRAEGPPIWVGSWGSAAGLRRTARLADGWLASAYNTTPQQFGEAWTQLREQVSAQGKDAGAFPNALATMWFYISDDTATAERVMRERIVPTINRPEDVLRERLPVGPAEMFAEKLSAFAMAGVQRVFVWPVADEAEQLERFWAEVRPAVRP
jgi:alkanesulfonate monooxygenase SsuD/methylene tetrahydromethanopterin reductase-like flavin-dependent oxidoreductase (luciferase family)